MCVEILVNRVELYPCCWKIGVRIGNGFRTSGSRWLPMERRIGVLIFLRRIKNENGVFVADAVGGKAL